MFDWRFEQVARMNAAICGEKNKPPDVASLIRATLAIKCNFGSIEIAAAMVPLP